MNSPSSSRLARLIDLKRENQISRIQMAELEEMLQDESHMDYYVETMAMDSMLNASFSNAGTNSMADLFPQPPIDQTHRAGSVLKWASLAAVLTLVATIFWLKYSASTAPTATDREPSLAMDDADPVPYSPMLVKGSVGLAASQQDQYSNGSRLTSGQFFLTSGLLELRTSNGSLLMIQAPAQFEIQEAAKVHLDYGKLLVQSPSKFNSVTVSYGRDHLIQGGENFAIEVLQNDQRSAKISSFIGSIVVRDQSSGSSVPVAEHESLSHLADGSTQTIPFEGQRFVRHLPAEDLAWSNYYGSDVRVRWLKVGDADYNPKISFNNSGDHQQALGYGITQDNTLRIDVSKLVWRPGKYRAVLKWVGGSDAMVVEQIQLYHQGDLISQDIHMGKTGDYNNTRDHIYEVSVPRENFQTGDWEIRARVRGVIRSDGSPPKKTEGVLYFVADTSYRSTIDDFVGDWQYRHNGDTYTRRIYPNKTAQLLKNGEVLGGYQGIWWVEDSVLKVRFGSKTSIVESHLLRDKNTLLFLDQPYNNASRVIEPTD